MLDDYKDNPQLFDTCLNLIDEAFPGCKAFALHGIRYNANWHKASIPFVLKAAGEIVAHAGVWPVTFMLNGEEHRSASIHGVCVKASYRKQGYFQALMQEVLPYVTKHFDSSVLFTTKPYLYKLYPYTIMLPEYDFIVNEKPHSLSINCKSSANLRSLHWDNANDINLLNTLILNRVPLSKQLSLLGENSKAIFILNMLEKKIYYAEQLNVLLVYEIFEQTLYLKEIISEQQSQLSAIISLILARENRTIDKIVLQFCPDNFLDETEYSPVLAKPECCVMTSATFAFQSKYFRYPELYWC